MSLNHRHPTALRYVNDARARWGRITAFRLGYLVGEQGVQDTFTAPYEDARGAALFNEGVRWGADHRRRFEEPTA